MAVLNAGTKEWPICTPDRHGPQLAAGVRTSVRVGEVLPVTWATVRVFLHVLAATVWVGGQLTLAGLVPGLRSIGPDAPRTVARRFNQIAWPAFGVLVATGIWNLNEDDPNWDTEYGRTVMVKIVVVAASGVSAFLHTQARRPAGLAVFGALSGLTALTALFLGVQLG
jgi:putative copper export protein